MTHRSWCLAWALVLLSGAGLAAPKAPVPAGVPAALPAAAPASSPEREADRADVAPTQIIGNRELPKVLYIVPWKKPQVDALNGRPPVSVLDEILAPVDRDVFARQVRYRAEPAGIAPTAAPDAAATPSAAPR
jgi:hypothetical protein